MNTSELLVTGGKSSLAEGWKGDKGVFARMFTIEGRREQFDGFAHAGEEKVLPALRRLDGFDGLLILADRQNGKILVVTLWESEEAMRGSEAASHWFRAFVAEVAGGKVTDVERYEVVYSEAKGNAALAGARDHGSWGGG
jgi:heme-degrading monooxygenase HmoA